MLSFVYRRVLVSLALTAVISVISFFMITLTPGSPFPWGDLNPQIASSVKEEYRKRFHLDRPVHEQYWLTITDLVTGRLVSMKDSEPVISKIARRLPATLLLAFTALVFVYGFGLLVGIHGAQHRGRWPDALGTLATFACVAIPGFWIAYLVVLVLANMLHVPVLGTHTLGTDMTPGFHSALDGIWHLLVPAFVLSLGGIAAQARYVRASLIEVLGDDYIRTARAKGLAPDAVLYKHALGNALRPLITNFGVLLPALLGGSIIIETIFAWPGMGRLGYEAVLERDYPVLVALNMVTALVVTLGNLLTDLFYALADPRVRFS
jgi:peptide/nickel transport system permease protein